MTDQPTEPTVEPTVGPTIDPSVAADVPTPSPIAPPIPPGTSDVFQPIPVPEPPAPVTVQLPVETSALDDPHCPFCGSPEYVILGPMRICNSCKRQYTLQQAEAKVAADKLVADQNAARQEAIEASVAQRQDSAPQNGTGN